MKKFCLFIAFVFALLSCEDTQNARIEVWLTDDPGDFQEVNVDIQAVEVHSSETDHERGWNSIGITPSVYNLLDLTNGKETFLGDLDLPGGRLSQIRLKLGENNTIKVNDQTLETSRLGLPLQACSLLLWKWRNSKARRLGQFQGSEGP